MPLKNRVNPQGIIERDGAKGTFMGNRGVLHESIKGLRAGLQARRSRGLL